MINRPPKVARDPVDHRADLVQVPLPLSASAHRPNMRFVPIKTVEQQSVLVLHRSRDLLMRQRTMMLNAIRAHLAEFGNIAAQGPSKVVELVAELRSEKPSAVPEIARVGLLALAAQHEGLTIAIRGIERQLLAWHRQNAASQRLETIPGIGIITATALAASVPDPSVFNSGRQFAAFLGLVPRQNSSGGKDRLGHISKMGNGYLRRLLVVGATSVTRRADTTDTRTGAWVRSLMGRKPIRLVTVAITNKTAPAPPGPCWSVKRTTEPLQWLELTRTAAVIAGHS